MGSKFLNKLKEKMMTKKLFVVAIVLSLILTACGSLETPSNVNKAPSIYTDLGNPTGWNVSVSRMEDGEQTCYLVAGGTQVSISCPVNPKPHAESTSVQYTDMGAPEYLNGVVVKMQDGEQICFLIEAVRSVDISCP